MGNKIEIDGPLTKEDIPFSHTDRPKEEKLVLARCINSNNSENRIVGGEYYGLASADLRMGDHYYKVYEISLGKINEVSFSLRFDNLWYCERPGHYFLGEFSAARFELVSGPSEFGAAISFAQGRLKFLT